MAPTEIRSEGLHPLITQDGTTLHAPWKLVECAEPLANNKCLVKRVRPGICPCEHNAFALTTQNDPEVVSMIENDVKRNIIKCGAISQDNEVRDVPISTEAVL